MEIINNAFLKKIYSIEKNRELKRMIIIEKELEKIFDKKKCIVKKDKITNIKNLNIIGLETLLEKFNNKYDKNIKKFRKIYDKLISLGLKKTGLKEYKNETKNQKKKRIKKINKIYPKLIKILEYNKYLEKEVEIIHKKLNENIEFKRNN